MANLMRLKDKFAVAFGNDTDADRHGIVTPRGLMNPNHYLAVAIGYLFAHRPGWPARRPSARRWSSSTLIDRVAASAAAASCTRCRWGSSGSSTGCSTAASASAAKRAPAPASCAATAACDHRQGRHHPRICWRPRSPRSPGATRARIIDELRAKFGTPYYTRVDAPATAAQKAALKRLDPAAVKAATLAGDPIVAKLTRAPGNGAAIGGLKVASRQRLVRRPPVGHREHLQDLRREPRRRRPPGGDPRRGAGDRQRRPGHLQGVGRPLRRRALVGTAELADPDGLGNPGGAVLSGRGGDLPGRRA